MQEQVLVVWVYPYLSFARYYLLELLKNDNGRKLNRGTLEHPKPALTTLLNGQMLYDFDT